MIQEHYIQAHLLLCGLVPYRPGLVLVHGPEVGDPWYDAQPWYPRIIKSQERKIRLNYNPNFSQLCGFEETKLYMSFLRRK